jgi:hypothetical protein
VTLISFSLVAPAIAVIAATITALTALDVTIPTLAGKAVVTSAIATLTAVAAVLVTL